MNARELPTLAEKAGLHVPYAQGRQRTSHRPAWRPHQPVADARRPEGTGTGTRCEDQEGLGVRLMLAFPITLEDDDGTVLATSPDFPELTTFWGRQGRGHRPRRPCAGRGDRGSHPRPKGHPPTVSGTDLRHTADSHLGEDDAIPGDEGPGHRQGGVGPPPWVAHAAGGSRTGRSASLAARPDGRRPGSHRAAVARDRRGRSCWRGKRLTRISRDGSAQRRTGVA